MTSRQISSNDDIIDSRDIIERIAELREDVADTAEQDELESLLALAEEAEPYAEDWTYGVALIRDSYFQDYAYELADDMGLLNETHAWPLSCIDWQRAARELQYDYTAVDFDGVTYWVR